MAERGSKFLVFANAHFSAIFPLKTKHCHYFLFGSVLLLCKQSAILCSAVCMAGCMTGFCYAKEGQVTLRTYRFKIKK